MCGIYWLKCNHISSYCVGRLHAESLPMAVCPGERTKPILAAWRQWKRWRQYFNAFDPYGYICLSATTTENIQQMSADGFDAMRYATQCVHECLFMFHMRCFECDVSTFHKHSNWISNSSNCGLMPSILTRHFFEPNLKSLNIMF